jgi:Fic family protein
MTPTPEPRHIMLAEIAQRSGMSARQIYNLAREGKLPGTENLDLKPGQHFRPMETPELVRWMERTKKKRDAQEKNAALRRGKRPARTTLSRFTAVKYHIREAVAALADMEAMGTLDRDMPLENEELEKELDFLNTIRIGLRDRRLAKEQQERKERMAAAGVMPRA